MKKSTLLIILVYIIFCASCKEKTEKERNPIVKAAELQKLQMDTLLETISAPNKNLHRHNKLVESFQECEPSSLEVYIIDTDINGTNIRNEPEGEIILTLSSKDYFILKITEADSGWFKVVNILNADSNKTIPHQEGWIHYMLIEANTRKEVELLTTPKDGSIIGSIAMETGVQIKDLCSNWVEIEYKGMTGWIESKWLCGNPFTTCP